MTGVGVVVIGRNEGERLIRCLESVPRGVPVVYVDSGSSDGSVAEARSLGAEVVELCMATPFTAARARNAGVERLIELPGADEIEFVQFVDGDCEFLPEWLEIGRATLLADPMLGAVAGRLRERHPEASVYNRLCDLEWDAPAGPTDACGGIAMMRLAAFRAVGGFRDSLIAGEEPELCTRLRAVGWRIERVGADMALHDAAMTRFGQWWKRAVRAGYAYAEVSALHRRGPVPIWRREVRGIWTWGVGVPLLTVAAVVGFGWWGLLALLLYPLLAVKVFRFARQRWSARHAALYAAFCVLAKFPQARGQWRYVWGRLVRRPSRIIEYKAVPVAGGAR
jgi:GT2 family glycosyltransferase